VLVLTAHAEVDDAVRAMKLGARDYLRKPVDLAELQALIEEHLGPAGPLHAAAAHVPPPGFIAHAPVMLELLGELERVARSDVPVLFTGESGTGKEELARLLHRLSARADGPLVAVNVTALPEPLLESELFGSVRGAYTGADRERDGLVRTAQGGTLFLDEIGDMPASAQPKLLRVLEERAVKRVGATRAEAVDFRLVSATHHNLEAAVAAGTFRLDLYYRLAVVVLELPPLRQRREDILPFARAFLRGERGARKDLSPRAAELLEQAAWPGNIRELRNVVSRAALLAPGDRILPEHLPASLRAPDAGKRGEPPLLELERRAILDALERHAGNRTHAARALGISRRTLLYKLKEYRE
jgi:DNA-binding NtrC family response regulator